MEIMEESTKYFPYIVKSSTKIREVNSEISMLACEEFYMKLSLSEILLK